MDKMPEDLRWLAENVSKWANPWPSYIPSQRLPLFAFVRNGEAIYCQAGSTAYRSNKVFSEHDWQTARQQLEDERMDREEGNPSWSAWIAWAGGKCPLPSGAMHEVQFRSGERAKDDSPETSYWEHDQSSCDIVAYRYLIGRAEADPDERINNIARNGGDGLHYDVIMTEEEEAMGVDELVEWDESTFPVPIGARCECTFAVEQHDTWHKGESVFHGIDPEGREYMVVDTGAYQACFRSLDHIRPIRTKAERDREELESTLLRWKDSTVEVIAGILIDNGWKKDDRND